jgi:hypothetical protein
MEAREGPIDDVALSEDRRPLLELGTWEGPCSAQIESAAWRRVDVDKVELSHITLAALLHPS